VSLRFATTPLAGGAPGALAAACRDQRDRVMPAALRPALLALDRAQDQLGPLEAAGTLVITTGQQAGLFTGPVFAISKALSAAALAEELAHRLGTSVVPVFWVAGDDHDFAEINHCDVIAADGAARRLVLRDRAPDAPMLPAYREPVGAEGAAVLASLEAALPPNEFRARTIEWLARAYRAESSLAEAYAQALAELLGRFGVVVCRGWAPEVKRAAAPVLLGAARRAEALDRALAEEAQRLRAGGREAPVAVGDGLTLLMLEAGAGRDRLRGAGDGRFTTRRGGEDLDLAELERVLATEPARLSANVLLRPAVEAFLFPTVAYLGGPGELAYLAQTGPVFAALGVPRTAALPRLSGLLVEARVDRVLEKHGLRPEELARPEGEITAQAAQEDLPPAATGALAAARAALEERFGEVRDAAVAVDPTLQKPVESVRNHALHGLQEIEKKLVAALKRRNDTALQQLVRAREQLFPGGRPQERVVTVASFLARHGDAVLEVLHTAAREHARRLLEGFPGRA
jgi:bacillithiol biosynthesis cysteine-adding enzyme BshC